MYPTPSTLPEEVGDDGGGEVGDDGGGEEVGDDGGGGEEEEDASVGTVIGELGILYTRHSYRQITK